MRPMRPMCSVVAATALSVIAVLGIVSVANTTASTEPHILTPCNNPNLCPSGCQSCPPQQPGTLSYRCHSNGDYDCGSEYPDAWCVLQDLCLVDTILLPRPGSPCAGSTVFGSDVMSLCIAKEGGGVISDLGSQRSVGASAMWSCELKDFSFDYPNDNCSATIEAAPDDKIATFSIENNGGTCACRTTARDYVQATNQIRFT